MPLPFDWEDARQSRADEVSPEAENANRPLPWSL